MTGTNIDDLVLVCDGCGHDVDGLRFRDPATPWPACCGRPMRLRNRTTRDGDPIEREP